LRALANSALTSTTESRLAEWQGLVRVNAASAANAQTGRRAAKEAARARRYWHVCRAAAQGDLCGSILLNPTAESRGVIEAELQALLRTKTRRGAVSVALSLVAISLYWRRLVVVRPAAEEELRRGLFALSDLRDLVRSALTLRLRVEEDGRLTPVEDRVVRDVEFDVVGLVDAARVKGSRRRLKRHQDKVARLMMTQHEQGGGGGRGGEADEADSGSGSGSDGEGEDDGGEEEEDEVEEGGMVGARSVAEALLVPPPADDEAQRPAPPLPPPAVTLPALSLPLAVETEEGLVLLSGSIIEDIVAMAEGGDGDDDDGW
jgi:hypothetical protein